MKTVNMKCTGCCTRQRIEWPAGLVMMHVKCYVCEHSAKVMRKDLDRARPPMRWIEIVNGAKYPMAPGIWVDRRSALGNPFTVKDHGREKAIELYKDWLTSALQNHHGARLEFNALVELYRAGRPLALKCHCAPLPCHANVIAQLVRERA